MVEAVHPRRVWVSLAVAAWGLAVFAGAAALWSYKLTPGMAAVAPAAWPSESRLPRAPDRPTLVMLAHPRCVCTRASVSELARLMTATGDAMAALVVFVRPEGVPAGWEHTDTWSAAESIPGVRVWSDEGGVEAERFGGVTSGQALLYDTGGELLFAGGITPGRGHQGDSIGRSVVLAAVRGTRSARAETAVFGCPIF